LILLLLLLLSFSISIFTAYNKVYHIRGLAHHLTIFILFILLIHNNSKVNIFKNISNIFFVLGVLSLIVYVFQLITGQTDYVYKRSIGFVQQLGGIFSGSGANDSVGLFMVTFPFVLFKLEKNKLIFYLVIILSFFIVIQTQTRMAWIGFPMVVLFYIILNRKITFNYLLFIPIIIFIIISYIIIPNFEMLSNRLSVDFLDKKSTVSFRFYMWALIIDSVLNQPFLLGLGIYWSKLNIRTIAHNIFFEMLIWGGVLALIIFIFLILYLLYVFIFYKSKVKLEGDYKIFATSFSSLLAYLLWGMTANAWIPIGFLLFLLNLALIRTIVLSIKNE